MKHLKYVKVLGKVLKIFPFLYVLVVILVFPIIVGVVSDSPVVFFVAIIGHLAIILTIPFYLFILRKLTFPIRMLYTIFLQRFLFHLTQLKGFNTSYADISGANTIDCFYQEKKRSIRRRMTNTIPGKLSSAGLVVSFISSDRVGIANLKVQYIQARKYNKKRFDILLQVLGCFSLFGDVTEYRINGKLLGQGIGFLRGESYTILQYAAINEASTIGLWFYNIFIHLAHAIELKAKFVNGTIEAHKAEAKLNAGMVTCNDEALVFSLYGGKFTNLPKSFYRKKVTAVSDVQMELDPK